MKEIDLVEIRQQVKAGIINPFISGDHVYLSNNAGEVVCLGSVEDLKKKGEREARWIMNR